MASILSRPQCVKLLLMGLLRMLGLHSLNTPCDVNGLKHGVWKMLRLKKKKKNGHIYQKCCYSFLSHIVFYLSTWWRHQMETLSALLAFCVGNSPVTGEFPTQRPVTQSFDVFFDLHLNKRLGKQSCGWWFETPWCPLWRHRNDTTIKRCIWSKCPN